MLPGTRNSKETPHRTNTAVDYLKLLLLLMRRATAAFGA